MSKKDHSDYWALKYPETLLKHEVLEKYLRAYLTILKSSARKFVYIDGFAGRGYYEGGNPGSPIHAMQLFAELRRDIDVPMKLVFIEGDKKNSIELSAAVAEAARRLGLQGTEVIYGPFQEQIDSVLSRIYCNNNMCPIFIFVDPFGYRDIPFDVISHIARFRNVELLITFMSSFIRRSAFNEKLSNTMTRLYGTKKWQYCNEPRNRQDCLVRQYATALGGQIREGGFPTFVFPFLVKGIEGSGMYHLIHVSHHPLARKVMDEVVAYSGVTGRDAAIVHGLGLDDFRGTDIIKKAIIDCLQQTESHDKPVLDAAACLWIQEEYISLRWRDFEASVIELENTGQLEIYRPSGAPKRKSKTKLYPSRKERIRLLD